MEVEVWLHAVLGITLRLLYPEYPMEKRMEIPHRRCGRCKGEKSLASAGNRIPVVQQYLIAML
jgi:hypothetical protein